MQPQTYMLCSLILLISVLVHGQDNPVTITYTCDDNGLITDIALSDNHYERARVLQKNGKYCAQTQDTKDAVVNCITTNYQVKDEKVIIMYGDESHNGILGGQHMRYFSLVCTEMSAFKSASLKPVIITAHPDPTNIPHETSEVPKISIKSPPAQIVVGHPLTLQMSIKEKYSMQPENCTAYRVKGDPNSYTFWKRCSTVDEAIVPSSSSWTTNGIANGLQIDLFAFKFIGTDELVIECVTKVCPEKKGTECQQICKPDRRRRSNDNLLKLESNVKTETAAITLKVFDNYIGQQNGSQDLASQWYMTISGLVVICWTSFKR